MPSSVFWENTVMAAETFCFQVSVSLVLIRFMIAFSLVMNVPAALKDPLSSSGNAFFSSKYWKGLVLQGQGCKSY